MCKTKARTQTFKHPSISFPQHYSLFCEMTWKRSRVLFFSHYVKDRILCLPHPIFLCWNLIPNAMVSRDGAFEMIRSWGPMSKYYHIEWEQEIPKKRDSYQRDSRELSYPFYHIRTHTKKLCMNQEVSFHRIYLSAFDLGLPKIRNVFIQK